MVVRLNQLGIHDVADLANADVDALRQSLGSISRLIDVSSWIARARRQLRCAMVAAEERDETLPTARETFDMDRRCDYLMPAS
jgi:nucleotidyltransferase/DNA polymerase involved in DNA repair